MTRQAWRTIRSFGRRFFNSQRIANERHDNLVRQIEARSQDVSNEVKAGRLALVRYVEVRVRASEEEAAHSSAANRATLQKTIEGPLRKAIEGRAQLAAGEAKSYADHGLEVLGKNIAASNRMVVMAMRRIAALEQASAGDATRLAAMDGQIAERLNLIPDILNSRMQPMEIALQDLAVSLAEIRDVASAQTESTLRLDAIERELGRIVDDYNMQLRNAENRIEFVRSETMYEMQASLLRSASKTSSSPTNAQIVNPSKLAAMRETGLRLNVGCGHIQLEEYINVDGRVLPGVDVIADATDLPFGENEISEIRSSHLVEHFSSYILERVLLPHWRAALRPDGILTTIAPDGAAMLQAVNDGEMEFEDFRESLFGGQDYDGDFHYNLITPMTFARTLERAGFKDISEVYSGRRNGKCFEFQISAKKA